MGEVASLKKDLPNSDRVRLDALPDRCARNRTPHPEGRRKSFTGPQAADGARRHSSDFEEHIKLMFDLQVLAWQADITRVSTLLMAKELSGAVYAKSTIRDAFHTLSHHSNLKENMEKFAVLNRYHVTILTYLLNKLKSTPDGNGNLLDHSMVLYGSAMSDGNQHNHGPLPIVLAGGASGKLKGGRHIRNPKDTTMSNLLVAMLNKLDVPTEKFGDSTGSVDI